MKNLEELLLQLQLPIISGVVAEAKVATTGSILLAENLEEFEYLTYFWLWVIIFTSITLIFALLTAFSFRV